MKKKLIEVYLDWFNNYLSLSTMSEHYGLDSEDMNALIEMGKKYHEEEVELEQS